MAEYKVISSDSHIVEPPDLWATRLESKYRDQAPRIVRLEDGSDYWFCGDTNMVGMFPGTQVGTRFDEPEFLTLAGTFEGVRVGGYDPGEHVKDMDADGIDFGVLYPSCAVSLFRIMHDSDFLTALFRAYNNWVSDFCKTHPHRLKGIAMLNVDDPVDGIKEMERCAGLGFAGSMIAVYPPQGKSYINPEYEPLWLLPRTWTCP